jgi:hypothetical protein
MKCRKASQEVQIDFTKPQRWWDITVTYDGTPSWAMAAGDTAQEAEENFRSSIQNPELAVIVVIKPIGHYTLIEAMSGDGAVKDRSHPWRRRCARKKS